MLTNVDKIAFYRTMVIIVSTAALLIGCLYILTPFIPAILVATILALSAWPAFMWLDRKLGGRPTLSAAIITLLLAVCFLVPLIFLGTSMTGDFAHLKAIFMESLQGDFSRPPVWVTDFPGLGAFFSEVWITYAKDKQSIVSALQNNAGTISQLLLHYGGSIGHGILDLSLGVLIAFFFFRKGTQVAQLISALIARFGGEWGPHLLLVSKNTMIGVVYGILGTAIGQGLLAAAGFWIAHVPGAGFLGLLAVILSFVPGGFPILFVPITVWLFHTDQMGYGIFIAIWGIVIVCVMDFIVRPYFISLGSSLPLLLVLLGVFGGIIAFGFIGIFIGPTLLAVAYSLITELGRAEKQQLDATAP
ncbi:MAG: putative permease [Micavibrio sp.]|nr:putative permease [Micavibrio sp.]